MGFDYDSMTIGVASGKGGTGKTTVAVNLALTAPRGAQLLDCDVEEPNCHLFLGPQTMETDQVSIPVPAVDARRCNGCGECGQLCQYRAIVVVAGRPLLFPELCHGCGGCMRVCPTGAITEEPRQVGVVERGKRGELEIIWGRLNVGEPMAPPVIRAVKKHTSPKGLTFIDCPPGTSCPVIAALRDVDLAVLVTEPTPFGLHDLKLAAETVRQMGTPMGVVINRCDVGDSRTLEYCEESSIPVLAELPDDLRIAQAYSRGIAGVEAIPDLRETYEGLADAIRSSHRDQTAAATGERRATNRRKNANL